jgi:3-phenylpropionate/trans-cinnamate dioxygenase ferredoxin reductase subunit
MSTGLVIVGAGLAGAKAAQALREAGYAGSLTLVGDEPHHPYERPPLSKAYLQGTADRSSLFVHPEGWYAAHDIDLRLGVGVRAIDREAHEVRLNNGGSVPYSGLLLTTGSTPNWLRVPGAHLAGVHYLRRIEDSESIRTAFAGSASVVIVGGGWIGLETASAARAAGLDVTILEQAELPLLGVLGPELAQVIADLHRDNGVHLRCAAQVAEIVGTDGRVSGVRLATGPTVPADVVLVGVGITPNTELARAAGLLVANGIVVDEHLRTADPAIYAAGDVANAHHPFLRRHIRVEHWANALHQPAAAALSMLGESVTYDRLPFFYSDQYDLGLEYTGHVEPGGFDRVLIRGDVDKREFIAFWLDDGRVRAGMNVNIWDVTESIEALVRSRARVDARRLADPAVALTDVIG